MRRLLVATVMSLAVLSGVQAAGAITIKGTDGPDRLRGTKLADLLFGRGGSDRIDGRAGDDFIDGGLGRDTIFAGGGADRIAAGADRASDSVRCGAGRDIVDAELEDGVAPDCEVVSRQLSRDSYTNLDSQHETQVEPDSYAFGATVVTTYQSGRFIDGGASDIGFATSNNAARSWRSGSLPGLSIFSTPAGHLERVSDPSVAYDAAHHAWLIATLGLTQDGTEIVVSRSREGTTWSPPVTAAADNAKDYDKPWIACDTWRTSPFRGRCYVSYVDFAQGVIETRSSSDGGRSWGAPVVSAPHPPSDAIVNGVQPVVRPDGALVIVFNSFNVRIRVSGDEVDAIRSADGGVTFSPAVRVSGLEARETDMRAPTFVSADVDAAGNVYVAWSDCRFQIECTADGIVIARSRDGTVWAPPLRVPLDGGRKGVDYFVPGLAVDHGTSGARARLALTYYSLPQPEGCLAFVPSCTGVDVGLITSSDGGRVWSRPQQLNAEPMALSWMAGTNLGPMLGDYISTSFVRGRAVPVFALASAPRGLSLRQAIFATTRVVR